MDLSARRRSAQAAADKLVAKLKDNNWLLGTGFLGTPYLLAVLADTGHSDVAYRLLLNTRISLLGLPDRPRRHHHVGALERRPDARRPQHELLQPLRLRRRRRVDLPLRRRHRRPALPTPASTPSISIPPSTPASATLTSPTPRLTERSNLPGRRRARTQSGK